MIIKLLSAAAFGIFVLGAFSFFEKSNDVKFQTTPPQLATQNSKPETQNPKLETPPPEELGSVRWLRDLAEGTEQAKTSGKPLLILFQEVPGCSNCTRFGNGPLRHPLIVEAIESLFVPVCIYNNKGGKDAEALKKFGEPSWNNPVVRIVRGENHADVVARMSNFNSTWQIVGGMKKALEASGSAVPKYLELLENELLARESGTETATFSMHCFWVGEGTFGSLDGVIETEPGFQDGKEVVRVVFDPQVLKRADLEAKTTPSGMAACSKNEGFRSDREPKYYLSKTHWQYVPMTAMQAARANSLVGKGQSPERVLSPRQMELADFIKKNPGRKWQSAIGAKDLAKAWESVSKVKNG